MIVVNKNLNSNELILDLVVDNLTIYIKRNPPMNLTVKSLIFNYVMYVYFTAVIRIVT